MNRWWGENLERDLPRSELVTVIMRNPVRCRSEFGSLAADSEVHFGGFRFRLFVKVASVSLGLVWKWGFVSGSFSFCSVIRICTLSIGSTHLVGLLCCVWNLGFVIAALGFARDISAVDSVSEVSFTPLCELEALIARRRQGAERW